MMYCNTYLLQQAPNCSLNLAGRKEAGARVSNNVIIARSVARWSA